MRIIRLLLLGNHWYTADSLLHRPDTGRFNYLLNFDNSYEVLPPVYCSQMAVNDSFVLLHDMYMPDEGAVPADENTSMAKVLKAENENSALNSKS